jgi:hypothetical protein
MLTALRTATVRKEVVSAPVAGDVNIGQIYCGAARSSYRERIIEAFEEKVFP